MGVPPLPDWVSFSRDSWASTAEFLENAVIHCNHTASLTRLKQEGWGNAGRALEEASETNERGRRRKGAKGGEMKEKYRHQHPYTHQWK